MEWFDEVENEVEKIDSTVVSDSISKVENWKKKRCGLITSSCLKDILKKDITKPGVKYLYEKKYERRTGILREKSNAWQFDWGHEKEEECFYHLREKFPKLTFKSCSNDFDEIVFNEPFDGFGDSPDGYIYDENGKHIGMVEIKSPVDVVKIEMNNDVSFFTESNEHYHQILGHFIGCPSIDICWLVTYDAYSEEMHILHINRVDFELQIVQAINRIKKLNRVINMALKNELQLSNINNYVLGDKS